MFEIYSKDNIIDDEKAKIINNILIDNICKREENKLRPRSDFIDDKKYNIWLNMLRTKKDYHTLLFYYNNEVVAFISYMYINDSICLSEVQIKEEYQGKHNILRYMLNHILDITDKTKYNSISATISNNKKSMQIFTHIGMKNTVKNWYVISTNDLIKWINKYGEVKITN
ncbi:MAG: hypothetical protein IJ572_02940 [Bacilli bacterium]|nr:hypothetical protein [Bacilli bacterium]